MAMAPDLPPIFVINLDRAPDRWSMVAESLTHHGLRPLRVEGVDGRKLEAGERSVVDTRRFIFSTGRRVLDGEIGCHLSHRKALTRFVETGAEMGVILEDDVLADETTKPRLAAIAAAIDKDVDAVRLVTHRKEGFRPRLTTREGDRLGRTLFGPQGSAAAYLFRREAAIAMIDRLATMTLPYDAELERAWTRNQSLLTLERPLFAFPEPDKRPQTAIGTRADYRANKLFWLMRAPTAFFRARETVERLVYALR